MNFYPDIFKKNTRGNINAFILYIVYFVIVENSLFFKAEKRGTLKQELQADCLKH
jgi:hypothetical protein